MKSDFHPHYVEMPVPAASTEPGDGAILHLLFQCVCCAEDVTGFASWF